MSEPEQEEIVEDSEEAIEESEEETVESSEDSFEQDEEVSEEEPAEPVIARIDEQYDVYGNRIEDEPSNEEESSDEEETLPETDDIEEDTAVPEEPAPKKKGFFASLFGRKEKEVPVSEPEDSVYYSTEEPSETEEEDTE